jgi:DNA-damage-inducible protein J
MPTTIQVRTKSEVKTQVAEILSEMGLDMSTAINMYLSQIIITGSIPFKISTAHNEA